MTVVFNNDFTVSSPGNPISSIDSGWVFPGGSYSLMTTSATPRGCRLAGPSPGGSVIYSRTVPAHTDCTLNFSNRWTSSADAYSDDSFTIIVGVKSGTPGSGYMLVCSRKTFAGTSGYTRLYRSGTQIREVIWTPNVNQIYAWELQISAGDLKLYRDGVVFISYTDPSPLVSGTGISLRQQAVFPAGGVAPSDSNTGRLLKISFSVPDAPAPQNLDAAPVYSEWRTVTPTLIGEGFLNPSAVYSEFRTVTPTLVPVVYPLDVTPVFSRFYAVQPVLIGAETTQDVPPVYSEWHAVQPLLVTGAVLEPAPVYSEWYAVEPELIPGPVEIELTPVYSFLYTTMPSLAMELSLNPNAVYSEWYARKPTLKSRFPCGNIAALQDRIRGAVAQGGGASCNIGIQGSAEVVKRW